MEFLLLHRETTFKLAWTKSRKSYYTTPGVSVGGGVSTSFYFKVFYVMGKALSGELSCPFDRSCLTSSRLHWVTKPLQNGVFS